MNINKVYLCTVLISNCQCLTGQNSITPHTINSAGTSQAQVNNLWLEISVGEVASSTINNNMHTITQGVLQPRYGISTPIIEKENAVRVSIYPNPTTDLLKIEAPNIAITEVQVINMLGNLVMKEQASPYSFSLKALPSGTYVVKIICKEFLKPISVNIIKN